jgi:hypothetical protein
VGFALSGPILHGAHGHGIRAGASLALRVGLPLIGSVIGERRGGHEHYNCDFDNICDKASERAGDGLLLGLLGAAIIDGVVVAQPVELHPHAGVSWAPQISVTGQRASLGVIGSF